MQTNLAEAVRCRNINWKQVRQLVERGDDVNVVDGEERKTGLHYAAFWGNIAICELLLESGAKINIEDKEGDGPLHTAARRKKAAVCELLVAHRADVTAVNKKGQTPLILAIAADTLGVSSALCGALITKDSMNVADCDGNSALHIASRTYNIAIVQLLVNYGADTNPVNKCGQTPLHMAAGGWKDCPELCKILLVHGAEIDAVDEDGNQALHLACQQSHIKAGIQLVVYGADITTVNKHGQTPLHTAAVGWKDCLKLYEIFLKHNAERKTLERDTNQLACIESVKLMISLGSDINAVNKDGMTPLHIAAGGVKDCPDLCLLLIGKGAKVNAVDGNGDTSLQVALQKGNIEILKVLLANGADCKVLNRNGETVLHLLCNGGGDSHELCEDLIARGVSPRIADRQGNLPLHIALKNKLPKTSSLLCKQLDCLQKMTRQNSMRLLCFAVNNCDAESCQKLLDLGADPNAANTIDLLPDLDLLDAANMHPLHIAVAKNSPRLCRLLLDRGATVNVQMCTYDIISRLHLAQPLHLAVQLGFIDVCRLLITRGALINAETKTGKSPLDLAIFGRRDDIVRLLLSSGGESGPALGRSGRSLRRGAESLALLLHDSGEQTDTLLLCLAHMLSL